MHAEEMEQIGRLDNRGESFRNLVVLIQLGVELVAEGAQTDRIKREIDELYISSESLSSGNIHCLKAYFGA